MEKVKLVVIMGETNTRIFDDENQIDTEAEGVVIETYEFSTEADRSAALQLLADFDGWNNYHAIPGEKTVYEGTILKEIF